MKPELHTTKPPHAHPIDALPPPPSTTRHRSRYVPAILDAIVPGLGHLVAGRRPAALVFLSPLLVALAVGVWIGLTTSRPPLAASLLSSEVIWGLIAAQGVFLLWRLAAVGSRLFDPALPRPTGVATPSRPPRRAPAGHPVRTGGRRAELQVTR